MQNLVGQTHGPADPGDPLLANGENGDHMVVHSADFEDPAENHVFMVIEHWKLKQKFNWNS